MELTSEGAEFEPAARRVLDDFATALAGVPDRAATRSGQVSIALSPSLAANWLPAVLAGFRAKYPGIELHVADVLSEPCIDAVRSRDFTARNHTSNSRVTSTRYRDLFATYEKQSRT